MKLLGYRIQTVGCGKGIFTENVGDLLDNPEFCHAFNELSEGHNSCMECWRRCDTWEDSGRFMFTSLVTLRTICVNMLQWIGDNPGIYELVSVWGEGIDLHDVYYSTDGVQGVFHVERVTLQVEDVTRLNEEPKLRKDLVCI